MPPSTASPELNCLSERYGRRSLVDKGDFQGIAIDGSNVNRCKVTGLQCAMHALDNRQPRVMHLTAQYIKLTAQQAVQRTLAVAFAREDQDAIQFDPGSEKSALTQNNMEFNIDVCLTCCDGADPSKVALH